MGEAGADGFAGMGVGGVAKELAVGGPVCDVDESVAAVENGDGGQRMETGGGMVEARGAGGDGGYGEAREGLASVVQAAFGEGKARGGILACDARSEGG